MDTFYCVRTGPETERKGAVELPPSMMVHQHDEESSVLYFAVRASSEREREKRGLDNIIHIIVMMDWGETRSLDFRDTTT